MTQLPDLKTIKSNRKPFNITALDRPQVGSDNFFENVKNIVCTLDMESKQYYLFGVANCDHLLKKIDTPLSQMQHLSSTYNLTQLITKGWPCREIPRIDMNQSER